MPSVPSYQIMPSVGKPLLSHDYLVDGNAVQNLVRSPSHYLPIITYIVICDGSVDAVYGI